MSTLLLPPTLLYRIHSSSPRLVLPSSSTPSDTDNTARPHLVLDLVLATEHGLRRRSDFERDGWQQIPVRAEWVSRYKPKGDPVEAGSATLVGGKGQIVVRLPERKSNRADGYRAAGWTILVRANGILPILTLALGPFDDLDEQLRTETLRPDGSEVDVDVTTWRPFEVTGGVTVYSKEEWGGVWDSALVIARFLCIRFPQSPSLASVSWPALEHYLGALLRTTSSTKLAKVLDLSTGTGFLGMVVGAATTTWVRESSRAVDGAPTSIAEVNIALTDLESALGFIRDNLSANEPFLAPHDPLAGEPQMCRVSFQVSPLSWDDKDASDALGTFDLVLATDLAYEAEQIENLAGCLERCVKPRAWAILAYKRRALTEDEERTFWAALRRNFDVSVVMGGVVDSKGAAVDFRDIMGIASGRNTEPRAAWLFEREGWDTGEAEKLDQWSKGLGIIVCQLQRK